MCHIASQQNECRRGALMSRNVRKLELGYFMQLILISIDCIKVRARNR